MSFDDPFLDAAAAIGRELVDDAIWHDGRCNWIAARRDTAQPWSAEYRALEPNIYDGTAGVGLFLAHLYSVTGDDELRRTAAGALTQSIARVPAIPARPPGRLPRGVVGRRVGSRTRRRAARRGAASRVGARRRASSAASVSRPAS